MLAPIRAPGALHIHTTVSDGSGTLDEVVAAARAAGLRWIIVTDHNSLALRARAGWHGDILVIVDQEVTPDRNHYLAFGPDQVIDERMAPQAFIDATYAAGGFGAIAHPDELRANPFKDAAYRWEDWRIDGPSERAGRPCGIEIWNWMSDWSEGLSRWNVLPRFLCPALGIRGPTPAVLAWWDRLNLAGRRTFGFGGVDAHALLRRAPWGPVSIFPYRQMFATLVNVLLLEAPLAADAAAATRQVYAALGAGRLFFADQSVGDATAARFWASNGTQSAECGATLRLTDAVRFEAALPGARLQLIHNGRVLLRAHERLAHSAASAGVYRLEARRHNRPWLYTNPIFVEAE
ncbi:MAG: PHP domain-containing protein [Chloroflexi bacterium]|nr:PHP domain-containing protein [Chloroflexota bacterium]